MVDELFDVFEDLFDRRKKKKRDQDRDDRRGGDRSEAAATPNAPPQPAVFCLDCGSRNEGGARFCQECGGLLPSAGEEMRCLKCNAEVPLTAKFCGRCGARVA